MTSMSNYKPNHISTASVDVYDEGDSFTPKKNVPLPQLSAHMVEREINIIALTDSYILYEFSYIDSNKMKKWAKRLAPLFSTLDETYRCLIRQVNFERLWLGQ